MRRAIALAALLLAAAGLQGCSSWWSGTALGGATGFAGPGAAAIAVDHTGPWCPNLASQGSVPATGVKLSCVYDPVTGRTTETAEIANLDPQTILLKSMEAQARQAASMAALLQTLIPMLEKAAATAAGGPLGAAAADLLIPNLPPLPGPAAVPP